MMAGSTTYSSHLHPFVVVCIATALLAILFRVLIRSLLLHCKVARAKGPYGLEDIPQLKPKFPIVGNLPLLLPLKHSFQNGLRWCEQYGDIFKFYLGNEPFIVLNSAELVQALLKSGDFGHSVKSPRIYENLKPFMTNSVFVSKGHFWQGQRKILIKSQSFSNLKSYMRMLNKHGREMMHDLTKMYKDEQPKPVNFLIKRTFLRVIMEMVTGYDEERNEELDRYHNNIQIAKEGAAYKFCKKKFLLNLILMWTPFNKKYEKADSELIDFAREKLQKLKLDRSQQHSLASDDVESPCFRSVLDELFDAGMEDEQILDEFNAMLAAGHETIAGSIHFFCLSMALNPESQEKCRQEISLLLGNKNDLVLTYDDAQGGLKYLERCILETLRLYSPAYLIFRQLESPLSLIHKGKHIVLPIGTNAAVSPYALHRKPEYFPEPNIFNPDRFLPEEVAKRNTYAYIPFSAGPRNCLGMKFAMIEMKTIAAYIIHNFDITTTDKIDDVKLLPHVTLTPERDYVFTFRKRFV